MWADAVFEGGGVKGIGLVGALCVAEEKGYQFKRVAGTSAGAILAALYAAGYTGEELYRLLLEKDFTDFLAKPWLNRISYVGTGLQILLFKGIYPMTRLEQWLDQLLREKGVQTFGDLKDKRELKVIASDITLGNLLVIPDDLPNYGYHPDQFSVARAVCMSASIPFFFQPTMLMHRQLKKRCYVVDGGVLSNFPIWLFDEENPRWPTFGFRLISDKTGQPHEIRGPISLFRALFETMMDAHDNRYIREQDRVRTILVPALGIKLTDFSINHKKKQELFEAGVNAAEAFFKHFTFTNYLDARKKAGG